jgi:apolipoprotein N-acyltransferase
MDLGLVLIDCFPRCAGVNLKILRRIFLPLLIGSIASLGFAPFSLWIAPVLALFALFQILIKSFPTERIIITYFFGLGILLPAQHWTGVYVGNIPWLALCLMQALFFIPLALVSKTRNTTNPFIFATSLVLSETLMRTIPFTGFGWSRLGFTQVGSPFADFYPILGVAGVAFLIALTAGLRKIKHISILLIFLVAINSIPLELAKENQIKIALVQGGVSKLGLSFNAKPTEVYQNHFKQSKLNIRANSVDLIIWPENAVDIDIFKNDKVMAELIELSRNLDTPILVGGISRKSGSLENISILFNPEIESVYTKRYLTPFGEYIPLRNLVSKFSNHANSVSDFSAGSKPVIFKTKNASFETLICYELLNDVFRDDLNSGILVVQTNNATFGDTAQLAQLRNIAQVRALETSRETAYVSTTGITSFIDSKGEIKSEIPKFSPGVLIDEIQLVEGKTLAAKLRFYPEVAAFILLLFLVIWRRRN